MWWESYLKPAAREVIVATAAGNQVTVTLSDKTTFMRIPPGEKTRDKFVKISPTDFGLGDSIFARGRMSEDRKNLPALEFYVMSKGEIAQTAAFNFKFVLPSDGRQELPR